MRYRLWFIKVLLSFLCLQITPEMVARERDKFSLHGTLKDAKTKQALEFATILLKNDSVRLYAISDINGHFNLIKIPAGYYTLNISFVGYHTLRHPLSVSRDTTLALHLQADNISLQDIIVTASESRGLTSSSKIDRKAMELLQPSSFTDILSLLPGGISKDPALGSVNQIRLREVGVSDTDYDVSSLGTSFLIDGIPLSTNANMQQVAGTSQGDRDYKRNSTGKGVDMRTLSTDGIENVEIIRGIPSVEYGELTSGLIKITRKSGAHAWEARVKADPGSKLAYLGKGFQTKNGWILNLGADYLDARIDPRNELENYKRITASARLNRVWNTSARDLFWNLNADYGLSADDAKSDPELTYKKIDKYKSSYNRMALSSTVEWKFKNARAWKSVLFIASLDYSRNVIKQTKFISLEKDTPIPDNTEEGAHDGIFLPYRYTAYYKVDGQPLHAFVKITSNFHFDVLDCTNRIKAGMEWSMDKNLGKGQVFDPARPLYPSMKSRPRPYNDIPAEHSLSMFIEDALSIPFGHHQLEVAGGARGLIPLNLDKTYRMNNKIYLDPRVNALWKFPAQLVFNRNLNIQLAGGIGWHTKMPVMSQLYPDMIYRDLTQFNYYHPGDPEKRRLNIMTYKIDPTNPDLEPARNTKWEVRLDLDYGKNLFSVTYFHEKTSSGFRNTPFYRTFGYKKYDASAVDTTHAGPPDLSILPYTTDTVINTFDKTGNGSTIIKEGFEFQYSSKRIESIRTRVTINGAWFKSTYYNSHPIYKKKDIQINQKEYPYVGLYMNDDGYIRQQFSTNFMFDTYLQTLGLSFATSVQCTWLASKQSMDKNGTPLKYVDIKGTEHDYTEADYSDALLQHLKEQDVTYKKTTVPLAVTMNFKATKSFGNKIRLALFVNNILDYHPDYKAHGQTIRRSVTPYFGMELNLNL